MLHIKIWFYCVLKHKFHGLLPFYPLLCWHIIFYLTLPDILFFAFLSALLRTSFSLHFTICSPSSLCLPVKHSWSPTFLSLTISNQGIYISPVNLLSRSFPETARTAWGGVLQRDGRQPRGDAVEVPWTTRPELRQDYPHSIQHHRRPRDQHGWPGGRPAGGICCQRCCTVKQAYVLSWCSVLSSAA